MEDFDQLDIIQRIQKSAMEGLNPMDIVQRIQDSIMVQNEIEGETKDEGNSERKEEKRIEELNNDESDRSEDEENDNESGYDDNPDDIDTDSENNVPSIGDNRIDVGDEANDKYTMNASLASFAVAKAYEIRSKQYHPHQRLLKMKARKHHLDLAEPCYAYLLVVS